MAFDAKVWELFLAAPNDTDAELTFAYKTIADWNAAHTKRNKLILLPRHWTRDKAPNFTEHPQRGIDTALLQEADILVAIFRNKLGQGTRHEIEEYMQTKKPMLVYFCTGAVPRAAAESSVELADFKKKYENNNFYKEFTDAANLGQQFSHDLTLLINETHTESPIQPKHNGLVLESPPKSELNAEAEALLLEASNDPSGIIVHVKYLGGEIIQTNNKVLNNEKDARDCAKWCKALQILQHHGLIEPLGYKGENFKLTSDGYDAADKIKVKGSPIP